MPSARGVKRAASKTSTASASTVAKNKKKRGPIQLDIPSAPKRRGKVLTCGQGDVGQLGLGEDVPETTRFKLVNALGDKIVDVCAGGMHTMALDSDGKVWTFGCNDEGALGRATADDGSEGAPAPVALPSAAVAVSAGDSHSAALLDTGDVYAWGAFRDSHGSMGLVAQGRAGKACRAPARLALPERAVALASGSDHLLLLSVSGAVYTMGCGEQGQLGRLSQRSASRDARQGFSALLSPARVSLKVSACRVWAGHHASFALPTSGQMMAWGLNNYGQLGISGEKRKVALYAPTECDAFGAGGGAGGWQGVACGQHHSLALDAAGRVHAVGRCDYGRLGLGDRPGDAESLVVIPALENKKVVSIAAGTCNSFAVTDQGEILSWGMGSEGQLGSGASRDELAPVAARVSLPQGLAPAAVSAGGQHTVLLAAYTSTQKESSPAPESESAEQTQESEDEEKAEVPPKKQKKSEQEEEISSTSAQTSDVAEETQPEKVNGDEKTETPMEVDETDKTETTKAQDETPKQQDKTTKQPEETKPEQQPTEPSPPAAQPESKLETSDTSSQDTADSDTKTQDTDSEKTEDVEMTDKAEVNGTPDAPVETKSVESIQSASPITTTA